MKRIENKIPINFDYLYDFAKEHGIRVTEIGLKCGRGISFISDSKKTNGMGDAYARLICSLYNMDYEKLTTIPKKEEEIKWHEDKKKSDGGSTIPVEASKILDMLTNLSERMAVLEKKVEAKEIILTEREQVVLLLQQMLKFGSCEESLFKSKAKSYGFDKELMDFAIESLNLNRTVSGGKVWLEKKEFAFAKKTGTK
jgi:hypothetical protein